MKLDMSIGIQKHVYYIYIYKVQICFVQTHTIFFHALCWTSYGDGTRAQEKHYSRMQGKWSEVRNFPSEEHKQSKNHCSSVKLERKKNDKKIFDPGRDRDGKLPSNVEEKPRPVTLLVQNTVMYRIMQKSMTLFIYKIHF